jgi:membrane protease YdiL (CAAX protease family)
MVEESSLTAPPLRWRLPARSALVGIAAATVFWFLLFSPATALSRTIHGTYFWLGMAAATTLLGGATLLVQRGALRRLFRYEPRFLWIGLAHAVLLYALSRLGVWIMATFFSWVMPQVQAIYATRGQLDPRLIALTLVLVIAPFEEIFWRGLVLDKLLDVAPARLALVASVALYCLVHAWALNPMLLVAALVLGAHWSYLYFRFRSLVPGLVSHALWDVAIFVLFPVTFRGIP